MENNLYAGNFFLPRTRIVQFILEPFLFKDVLISPFHISKRLFSDTGFVLRNR